MCAANIGRSSAPELNPTRTPAPDIRRERPARLRRRMVADRSAGRAGADDHAPRNGLDHQVLIGHRARPARLLQRRRRAEYHRRKSDTDPVYAQVVIDSQKKWRDAHPDYQTTDHQTHPAPVERNRMMQPGRDAKHRAQFLVKNNLASCKMFISQPAAPGPQR